MKYIIIVVANIFIGAVCKYFKSSHSHEIFPLKSNILCKYIRHPWYFISSDISVPEDHVNALQSWLNIAFIYLLKKTLGLYFHQGEPTITEFFWNPEIRIF